MLKTCIANFVFSAVCESGEFKSNISNSNCLPCPLNSNSSTAGAFVCNCKLGWYRTAMDPPESSCTGEGSRVLISSVQCGD